MEQEELYKQFRLDEPWDSEHNKPLAVKMPAVFKDPQSKLEPGMTVYQAVVGKGCVFEGVKGVKLAQCTDGTSRTAGVIIVAPKNAVPWTKPDDWEFDRANPLKGLDNAESGRLIQAVFMDGHVEAFKPTTDPNVVKAIFTRNGGERVQLP